MDDRIRDGREGRKERRLLSDQANQWQRAIAAVMLAVDALPARARLVVLHEALRNAVADYDKLMDQPDL